MVKNTNCVVYQAYGLKEIMHEAMISVASLYKVTPEGDRPEIFIYTDQPDYFKKYLPSEVSIIYIGRENWLKWQGQRQFVHRAKIEMLLECTKKENRNILYCDTDTYFTQSPKELFNLINQGDFVMHMDEGTLKNSSNLVFQKLDRFFEKNRLNNLSVPSNTHMWNAGVLGFRSADSLILQEILNMADRFYEAYQKHVMEQLAFSLVFGKHQLHSCENVIFHYWNFKEYRIILNTFFQNCTPSFEKWKEESDQILPMELIKEKFLRKKMPVWKRSWMKIFGKN